MPIISAKGLVKTYVRREAKGLLMRAKNEVHALKGVSFDISAGELVGYIGPNGAGKSTTVKILSGILTPDGGECDILGLCPWRKRAKHAANIGVVFGQRSQLWWDLPVEDSFRLLKEIYRISKSDYESSLGELAEALSLKQLMRAPVRQLSLGQRMKCELAASLLHRPKVLFLDEPTIGLDAVTKLAVRDFIKYINAERGVTAILTTHDMDDIEALCSRVMLIGEGQLLLDGTLAELRRGRDERVLKCEISGDAASINISENVTVVTRESGHIEIHFDPDAVSAAEIISEINSQTKIGDITVESAPIERVVAKVYGEMAEGKL